MNGRKTRAKGRKGETEAKELLASRDWVVADLSAGLSTEDLLATDTNGKTWAIEVKNTVSITQAQRKQAIQQSKNRRQPWMLMNKIAGTSSWLIQRQGEKPVVWHNQGE